jgi:hypothetical protein
MPRKHRHTRLSVYDVPVINPKDRNAVEDHDLVRHVLVDFDELAVLSGETREQIVANLVRSIRFARAGVKAGKRGVSDKALTQQIIMSDVARALEPAGLPVTRWRKQYDNGGGESFFFRLAREIARLAGIDLPKDLKLPGKRAAQHQYGVMSPTMVAAQNAELAAWRQRLSELVLRLETPLAPWRQRLNELVLRLQAAAPKVQG